MKYIFVLYSRYWCLLQRKMSNTLYENQNEDNESGDELYECKLCGNIWDGNAQCVCGMLGNELEDSDSEEDSGAYSGAYSDVEDYEDGDEEDSGVVANKYVPSPDNSIPIEEDQTIEQYYRETNLQTIESYNFNEEEVGIFVTRLKEGWCVDDVIDEIRLIRLRHFANTFYNH